MQIWVQILNFAEDFDYYVITIKIVYWLISNRQYAYGALNYTSYELVRSCSTMRRVDHVESIFNIFMTFQLPGQNTWQQVNADFISEYSSI